MVDPGSTSIIILAQMLRACPKMRMSRSRVITIVPKLPAVDSAVASTLVAQVLEQPGAPVIGPVPLGIDVDFGIVVRVAATAPNEGAVGPVVALFKGIVGTGLSDSGRCCGRQGGQGGGRGENIAWELHCGRKQSVARLN